MNSGHEGTNRRTFLKATGLGALGTLVAGSAAGLGQGLVSASGATTTLALAAHELAAANVPGLYRPERRTGAQPTFEVCFVTDDVQGAFDRAVAEGAAEVTPLQTKPWGQDVAYVRDPDGNLVEIASPAGGA